MSLYAITDELQSLLKVADESGMESVEFSNALAEHTQLLVEAFDAKADDYAALIRQCDAMSTARAAEAERMKRLSDADALLSSRLKNALLLAMNAVGRTKIKTARFNLSIAQNGGKIPVLVDDETLIPAEYKIPCYSETVDKEALRSALESGKVVEGARLGKRGSRLSIK